MTEGSEKIRLFIVRAISTRFHVFSAIVHILLALENINISQRVVGRWQTFGRVSRLTSIYFFFLQFVSLFK